jgi:choline dehydrogenase-like flavoprotein
VNQADRYDILVLGSGAAGKLMAWAMAREGKRTAVVERKLIGGSCPNVACLPSKKSTQFTHPTMNEGLTSFICGRASTTIGETREYAGMAGHKHE